jgi:hypothetical protein
MEGVVIEESCGLWGEMVVDRAAGDALLEVQFQCRLQSSSRFRGQGRPKGTAMWVHGKEGL